MKPRSKCHWSDWAFNKVEELTKEQILADDDIIQCYKCREPGECMSYIGNLYTVKREEKEDE